jgi:hypothetical protein
MRRYFFYVAASLLTFSIGLFVVLQVSNWQNKPLPKIAGTLEQKISQNEILRSGSITIEGYSQLVENSDFDIDNKKKPIVCNDKTISLVWKQLQNSQKDFWDWVNSTMKVYDCAQMFEAKRIDLNNDGIKEIKTRGQFGNFCGATGNCSEWIFGKLKHSNKYKLILDSGGEYFYLRKKLTNGYRDIYITTHDSASSSYHMIYKFNGKRYKEAKCWFSDITVAGQSYTMSCDEKTKISEKELRESEAKLGR